jgi:hypothetical protein
MRTPYWLLLVYSLLEDSDRFPLPPGALPIGDTSLTHVMTLAAHSTIQVSQNSRIPNSERGREGPSGARKILRKKI